MKKITKNKTNSSKKIIQVQDDNKSLIAVLDTLPIGVIIFSLSKGNILFINKIALKILKSNSELKKNITKHSIFEFLLPQYHQRIKENNQRIFNGEEFVPYELKIKNAKNEIIDLEIKSTPLIFNGQNAIQTIFKDVSEVVKYRNKLIESNNKLELITKNANDLIYFYTYHPQPKYLYISPNVKNILGYDPDEFYENPFLCAFNTPNIKEFNALEKNISKLQKTGKLKNTTHIAQYKTKSGKLIWLEDNYSPIFNENGKIEFILGISRDITKEKIIKLELEQKWINYKNLIDSSPVGIYIHKGVCLYCNTKAVEIVEAKSAKAVIGKNVIEFIVPEEREIAVERITNAIKGQEQITRNYKIKTLKGNYKIVELRTTPFMYNGETCVQTTAIDVTAQQQLSKEILRAELAEESNKLLKKEIAIREKAEKELINQSAKLQAIFESGNQLIWTVNKEYLFTSFNTNFSNSMFELYKIKPEINKYYKPHHTKEGLKYHKWWIEKYETVFESGKGTEFTTEQKSKDGKTYYRQIFIQPIIKNNQITELYCISHDITELTHLQNEAVNQALKLNSIFNNTSHAIWTVDRDYFLTSFNNQFIVLFKKQIGVKPQLNQSVLSQIPKEFQAEYKSYWFSLYDKVFAGNTLKLEYKNLDLKGNTSYLEIFLNPIKNTSGQIVEVACLSIDITEHKLFEQQIINQSAKLKAIFESGSQLMWTISKDLKITSFNQNYADAVFDLYNYYPEIGKPMRSIKTQPYQSIWDEKYKLAFEGNPVEFISERENLRGEKVIRQMLLHPIKDNQGNVIEVSGIGFDITENKLNEERISQSLKEKEVLLKEVHHRVKNNMQVISSILNLQSSYVTDVYALNLLKECQNRIKSMSFIHESLYQSKNFEMVNFTEYISTLAKNLVHSYTLSNKNIKLILTLDNLALNLDLSIPCGLIINEIISNSLKYAFSHKSDGIIFVTLRVKNQKVSLEIGDNGIGIPDNFDIKNSSSLGLQLVDTLIEQIGGTYKLIRNNGTIFSIEFNI